MSLLPVVLLAAFTLTGITSAFSLTALSSLAGRAKTIQYPHPYPYPYLAPLASTAADATSDGGTRTDDPANGTAAAAAAAAAARPSSKQKQSQPPLKDSYDVIVVGSGIGGLSCAAMLSFYGYSVAVLESHYSAGGAAHGFMVKDKELEGAFTFDTGPSFFSGLNPNIPPKASNPLRTVLDIIGEQVECIPYTTFGLKFPEGDYIHTPNFGGTGGVLDQVSGDSATNQWKSLLKNMEPLAAAVAAMPTAALRGDIGTLLTAAPFLKNFASLNPLENLKLTKPFSSVVNSAGVADTFTRNWLDLLCFCLSGMPADGTVRTSQRCSCAAPMTVDSSMSSSTRHASHRITSHSIPFVFVLLAFFPMHSFIIDYGGNGHDDGRVLRTRCRHGLSRGRSASHCRRARQGYRNTRRSRVL
jgi:hypothetical protein